MAYKKIEQSFSFADIAIQNIADKNRTLLFLRKIDNTIDWEPVQEFLMKFYKTGKAKEGERAYSPLLLFRCMPLQKWFQIKSDPELENLVNDRISFKSFLKLPLDYQSPDHSTSSRFRKRLSKDAMVQINSALLKQFHQLGLSINEGIAVVYSMHADKIQIAYADKGYAGAPNREFLALNNIRDGIMRKNNGNAKLTDLEIERNKAISKYRYIVEQYFGISHLHDNGNKARFPKLMKNIIDIMFRQFAFNLRVTFRLKKGTKIFEALPV